jgi:hypothetical protein
VKALSREMVAGSQDEGRQAKLSSQPFEITKWGMGREAPGVDAGLSEDFGGGLDGKARLPLLQYLPDKKAPSTPGPEPPGIRESHHMSKVLRL